MVSLYNQFRLLAMKCIFFTVLTRMQTDAFTISNIAQSEGIKNQHVARTIPGLNGNIVDPYIHIDYITDIPILPLKTTEHKREAKEFLSTTTTSSTTTQSSIITGGRDLDDDETFRKTRKSDVQKNKELVEKEQTTKASTPLPSTSTAKEQLSPKYTSIERTQRFTGSETSTEMPPLTTDSITTTNRVEKELLGQTTNIRTTSTDVEQTNTESYLKTMEPSKRGGYIDMSPTVETTTMPVSTVNDSTEIKNAQILKSEVFESDSMKPEKTNETDNIRPESSMDIQDIDDQLLTEELMENNAKFSLTGELTPEHMESSTDERPNTKDDLSVKPISTKLYSVNPSYKKMKKIEVMPAKPFVRDPDDNSWRNESLTSLGIVFKANNSSKTFTEVLKNKTETEFINASSEKEGRDVPELRERLEKLAEERKSKKKKTESNDMLDDYDDFNLGYGSFNEKIETGPGAVLPEIVQSVFQESDSSNYVLTTNPNLVKTLTTAKPKKLLNILEYFDTGDDGFDYMSMHNLDLKKSKTNDDNKNDKGVYKSKENYSETPKTSEFPERKPTVQYFPPKNGPKVIFDDYDHKFHSKMNTLLSNEYTTTTTTEAPIERHNIFTHNDIPRAYNKENDFRRNYYLSNPEYTIPENGRAYQHKSHGPSDVLKKFKNTMEIVSRDDEKEPYVPMVIGNEDPPQAKSYVNTMKFTSFDQESQIQKDGEASTLDSYLLGKDNPEMNKADYPVIFNSSVVHKMINDGRKILASSRAFLRQHHSRSASPPPQTKGTRSVQSRTSLLPKGDPIAVDLTQDYEMHYYLPQQKHKQGSL